LNMDSVVVVDRRRNLESRATGRPTSDGRVRWWLRFSMGGTIVDVVHDMYTVYPYVDIYLWWHPRGAVSLELVLCIFTITLFVAIRR
jgi:hypothetical protein